MASTNLTAREHQVFELIGSGSSTKEIAQQMRISVWTVASHRKRICAKLGVHTTAELVAMSSVTEKSPLSSGRSAERCHLKVDFCTRQGRVCLTYSGRLKRKSGIVIVQIGRRIFHF